MEWGRKNNEEEHIGKLIKNNPKVPTHSTLEAV